MQKKQLAWQDNNVVNDYIQQRMAKKIQRFVRKRQLFNHLCAFGIPEYSSLHWYTHLLPPYMQKDIVRSAIKADHVELVLESTTHFPGTSFKLKGSELKITPFSIHRYSLPSNMGSLFVLEQNGHYFVGDDDAHVSLLTSAYNCLERRDIDMLFYPSPDSDVIEPQFWREQWDNYGNTFNFYSSAYQNITNTISDILYRKDFRELKILDCGCGKDANLVGHFETLLEKYGIPIDYTGVDPSLHPDTIRTLRNTMSLKPYFFDCSLEAFFENLHGKTPNIIIFSGVLAQTVTSEEGAKKIFQYAWKLLQPNGYMIICGLTGRHHFLSNQSLSAIRGLEIRRTIMNFNGKLGPFLLLRKQANAA